jgi:hypothetical protein
MWRFIVIVTSARKRLFLFVPAGATGLPWRELVARNSYRRTLRAGRNRSCHDDRNRRVSGGGVMAVARFFQRQRVVRLLSHVVALFEITTI